MSKRVRPKAFPLAVLLGLICVSALHAQVPSRPAPLPTPAATPRAQPAPTPASPSAPPTSPKPSPTPTPTPLSSTPQPSPTPASSSTPTSTAQPSPTPALSSTPATPIPEISRPAQGGPIPNALSLDEVLRLANTQASSFQSASINERIAAEDVRQAQAAFLPKITAPLSYIYTSPALGLPPGEPRIQSFIANNAIGEY